MTCCLLPTRRKIKLGNKVSIQNFGKKGGALLIRLFLFTEAAIDANAPALLDEDLDPALAGPVDSDEERDSIMTAISRSLSRPQPLMTRTLVPTKRKYQLVRMKEMLSNALSGNRSGGLFSVPAESVRSTAGGAGSAPNDTAFPQSVSASPAPTAQPGLKAPMRKASIDVS